MLSGSTSAEPSPTPCSSARTPPSTPPRSPPRPPSSRSPCSRPCAWCSRPSRRARRSGGALRPRHDRRDQRAARGPRARTALIATAGFTDVIELGRQARPHLYRLCLSAPAPLVGAELRFAAPERIGPDGPLRALDPARRARARAAGRARRAASRRGGAAALLRRPRPRAPARRAARRAAAGRATCRSPRDLVGTFREYERTATTVLDAALSPLLEAYLRGCPATLATAGCPSRRSCSPRAASPTSRAPPPTPR